jgi:putative hydrolase of the HAD superfamily
MAHAIDPTIPEELIRQAVRHRTMRFEEALRLMPQTNVTTIQRLKASGKKLALLSNADKMEMAGWAKSPVVPFFDVVIFSCEAGCMKPDRQIYEICLEKLGESPDRCVFVGDGGSNEFVGAKASGLSVVMVTGIVKHLWPERLPAIQKNADYVIEDISELL